MSSYVVQVAQGDAIQFRVIEASSYEEAKSIIDADVTAGRIIAITKKKES